MQNFKLGKGIQLRNKLRSGDGIGHLLGDLHPLEFGVRVKELCERDSKMFSDSILLHVFLRTFPTSTQVALVNFTDYPEQQKILRTVCDELIAHEVKCSNPY